MITKNYILENENMVKDFIRGTLVDFKETNQAGLYGNMFINDMGLIEINLKAKSSNRIKEVGIYEKEDNISSYLTYLSKEKSEDRKDYNWLINLTKEANNYLSEDEESEQFLNNIVDETFCKILENVK